MYNAANRGAASAEVSNGHPVGTDQNPGRYRNNRGHLLVRLFALDTIVFVFKRYSVAQCVFQLQKSTCRSRDWLHLQRFRTLHHDRLRAQSAEETGNGHQHLLRLGVTLSTSRSPPATPSQRRKKTPVPAPTSSFPRQSLRFSSGFCETNLQYSRCVKDRGGFAAPLFTTNSRSYITFKSLDDKPHVISIPGLHSYPGAHPFKR